MLGWGVLVYRHGEATADNLMARWKSSSVGVGWLDLLVQAGQARDLGGSGYPCLYVAAASVFLPVIALGLLKRKFPPSSLARSAEGFFYCQRLRFISFCKDSSAPLASLTNSSPGVSGL